MTVVYAPGTEKLFDYSLHKSKKFHIVADRLDVTVCGMKITSRWIWTEEQCSCKKCLKEQKREVQE